MTVYVVTRVTPDHRIKQELYNRPESACEKILNWAKSAACRVDYSLKEFDEFATSVREDIYYGTRGEERTFIIGEFTLYYKEFSIDGEKDIHMPPC